MKEREVDDRVYDHYVTYKMGFIRDYDESSYERWSRNAYRQIGAWLPEDKTADILDAGCGHGNILHLLKANGYQNIIGVDRSPEQVDLAREITDEVRCVDVFEYLHQRHHAFDLILAFDLIEHFDKSRILEFLDLVFEALRPKGSLIVQTPNADSPWASSERYNDFTHEIAFNPHSLEHLVRMGGFVDFEAEETGPVVHGVASAIRWATWQLIRGSLAVWNLAETGKTRDFIYTRVFRARARRP